jgi:hypothetical protein
MPLTAEYKTAPAGLGKGWADQAIEAGEPREVDDKRADETVTGVPGMAIGVILLSGVGPTFAMTSRARCHPIARRRALSARRALVSMRWWCWIYHPAVLGPRFEGRRRPGALVASAAIKPCSVIAIANAEATG